MKMKKTILAVALVLAVIFSTFGFTAHAAEVAGNQSSQLFYSADSHSVFQYKMEKNDNFTLLAKRFETTIDKILAVNEGNKCVKNRNLILRGCKIFITLFKVEALQKAYKLGELAQVRETKQAKDATVIYSYIALTLAIFLIIVFVLWQFTKNSRDDWREKAIENSKTSFKSDQDLANANKLLATVQADLKNARVELNNVRATLRSYDGLVPGSIVKLKAQNGEEIPFKVTLVGLDADGNPEVQEVECVSNDCKTRVKFKNALSHYFQQHEATTEHDFPN